ncbi:MAG: hypothetical protein FWD73_04640 [Polyangiaceae bacterium]|nr:hypothetical protein [Polyangiaceae bacterium]
MIKSHKFIFGGTLFVTLALSSSAYAQAISSPNATTDIVLTSDWPNTMLTHEVGTSVGTAAIGWRTGVVTMVQSENVCRAPCRATVPTEGAYTVNASGMQARKFNLPVGSQALRLHVTGASPLPKTLSWIGFTIGMSFAILGGTLWATQGYINSTSSDDDTYSGKSSTSPYQIMTFAGAGVMIASIIGLIVSPSTHVDADNGERLDAKLTPAPRSGVRFTPAGFTF